ncbi:MAG TPA: hypothetical protein VFX76_00945 [Roseiflexaceae bacterium]|nr:hypothetical protein [Roseiflexaceae bacterium]
MSRILCVLLLFGLLASCGGRATISPPPTSSAPTAPLPDPAELLASAASPMPSATPTPISTPISTPAFTPTSATAFERYRAWMAEARAQYPYEESLDSMWAVMMCESEGNPELSAGEYHGLFQYSAETWSGEWNPYRATSIFDPHAQIFATAKAWHEGNQGWWGCYR